MSLSIKKRVISDLVIAFGYSKENAEIAWHMYKDGRLSDNEMKSILYIEERDPFKLGIKGPYTLLKDTIKILEHLNYRISEANK